MPAFAHPGETGWANCAVLASGRTRWRGNAHRGQNFHLIGPTTIGNESTLKRHDIVLEDALQRAVFIESDLYCLEVHILVRPGKLCFVQCLLGGKNYQRTAFLNRSPEGLEVCDFLITQGQVPKVSFQLVAIFTIDADGAVSKAYQVTGLPATFFIDRQGVIQHVQIGQLREQMLEEILARIL